ncbi:DUF3311 domain-containing protein [Natrinema sp. 1APR25-10V2]|uniref:DUF3311 domain-containing protein n=1 Tax=Natrinema sp. 1APR25-10V2 TaxID=2951081 RepID=UPI002874CC95|nr:DUF3311 domain-containing protein [Natrinema sp. 1APR25-10V2]MDS0476428.1 DUF3311 domain-containing protein [Natrinema sp. 1APR25-10V2]
MPRNETGIWLAVAIVLAALAVPWFLWGSSAVVAGLPVWLWWHVGWMGLASVVFWVFAQRAWGIGIEPAVGDSSTAPDPSADRARGPRSGGDSP